MVFDPLVFTFTNPLVLVLPVGEFVLEFPNVPLELPFTTGPSHDGRDNGVTVPSTFVFSAEVVSTSEAFWSNPICVALLLSARNVMVAKSALPFTALLLLAESSILPAVGFVSLRKGKGKEAPIVGLVGTSNTVGS